MIPQPPVLATSPAGTTNATLNNSGQTAQVTVTANGATMANYWVNAVSVATSASIFMMTVPNGQTCALQYTVASPLWYWSVITPAIAASTVAVPNNTGKDITVMVIGGTTTHIAVNGTDRGTTTPANVMVPAGGSIAITYSAAPVWAWLDYPALPWLDSLGTAYAQPDLLTTSGFVLSYNQGNQLPYAQHNTGGLTDLASAVSN